MWKWIGLITAVALAIGIVIERIKLWRQLPPVPEGVRGVAREIWRVIRPGVVLVTGLTLVIAGIVAIPLPGPGWAIVFGGVALLATEFVWARWLLNKSRDTAASVGRICGLGSLPPPGAGPIRLFIYRRNLTVRRMIKQHWEKRRESSGSSSPTPDAKPPSRPSHQIGPQPKATQAAQP